MHPIVTARGLAAVALLAALAACAPSSYSVKTPTPSTVPLAGSVAAPPKLFLNDQRPVDGRTFHGGILPAALQSGGQPIDPPAWLASALQAELKARGLATDVVQGSAGLPRIDLRTFRIQNHRTSGYSPFVTFTFISADLQTGPMSKRIGVFVKRGKVPVWSFDEIIEPTLNEPLSLATKELAAKIAATLGGWRARDADVDALAARLATRTEASFHDVYALAFTNNPRAIPTLAKLTTDADEYVRLAAISGLGTLGATGEFARLKSLAEATGGLWQDRAMALKSIGDLGTAEAKAYLQERWKQQGSGPVDNDATWTAMIFALYL